MGMFDDIFCEMPLTELSAKSFELRATTRLARLWQQQGKKAEARQIILDELGCILSMDVVLPLAEQPHRPTAHPLRGPPGLGNRRSCSIVSA